MNVISKNKLEIPTITNKITDVAQIMIWFSVYACLSVILTILTCRFRRLPVAVNNSKNPKDTTRTFFILRPTFSVVMLVDIQQWL